MKKTKPKDQTIPIVALLIILAIGCGLLARQLGKDPIVHTLVPKRIAPPHFVLPTPADLSKLEPIVKLYDRRTGLFFCSGTVISPNYILTAAHCIVGGSQTEQEIEIRTVEDKVTGVFAAVASFQGQSDLGLITGDFAKFNSLPVAIAPQKVLSAFVTSKFIVACGFPYGGKLFCSQVIFKGQYLFHMAMDGYLFPGMSGGPVLNAETGEIIGVNSAAGIGFVLLAPTIELFAGLRVDVQK